MKGRSAETAFDAGVGNAVIAVILVFIRYVRALHRGKLWAEDAPPVAWWTAAIELLLGLVAIIWTLKAV